MELVELQPLFDTYHRKLSKIDLRFKRYLYSQINWDARFIGIKGPRGVGKTTMLLQHILENYQDVDQALYASLDDLWFATHPLMDLVDWAYQHGIMRLYLDEVHRYNQWSVNLKNIFDNYPDMSIVYTSSSLLIMDNAKVDLSRRQTTYTLYGMSFREFLAYEGVLTHDALTFDDILQNHVRYAMQITKEIKVTPLFEAYLQHGYYPFYKESVEDFLPRLRETVRVVIDDDLPAVESVTFETIQKVKRLLMIISERVPFQPTMSDLWAALATNNELGLRMLYALDKAQILGLLTSKPKNYKYLNKPDKIFLGNPNLMHALCPRVEKGNERETFFYSQLIVSNEVKYPKKGDFYVNDKYLFELTEQRAESRMYSGYPESRRKSSAAQIGGRRKTFEQIADEPNSFLGVDNTEVGHGSRIPLWLFGFLY